MRSLIAPRVKHDGPVTLQVADDGTVVEARAVNLSTGGMLVESTQPFEPGARLAVTVSLGDELGQMTLTGEVVRIDARDDADSTALALKFVEVDEGAQARLQQFIDAAPKQPTGTFNREVRIRLPMWPAPIRATARAHSDEGLLLEAELPWLRVGGAVAAEVAPGEHQAGLVSWVGLEVSDGAPRLSIHVERSAEAEAAFEPAAEPDAPSALEPAPSGSVDIPVDDLRPSVDRDAPTQLLSLSDTVPVADADIEADLPAARPASTSIALRAALALSVGAALLVGGWLAGAHTRVAPLMLVLEPAREPPPPMRAPIVLRIPVASASVSEPPPVVAHTRVVIRRPTAPAPKRLAPHPTKNPARR